MILHTPLASYVFRAGISASRAATGGEIAWHLEALDDRATHRAALHAALRLAGRSAPSSFPELKRRVLEELRAGRLHAEPLEEVGPVAVRQVSERPAPLGPATTTWLEITLVDEDRVPIPKARYRVQRDDKVVHEGSLDDHGFARVEGLELGGDHRVSFLEIDGQSWRAA